MTTDAAIAAPLADAAAPPVTKAAPVRRLIGGGVLLAMLAGGGGYYLHARHYEDTDDAQVDGDITNVSPRVCRDAHRGACGR